MQIYSALQMGDYHLQHCEDYLVIADAGQNKKLIAVLDGCTMGRESYFISTLAGKILRKICCTYHWRQWYEPALAALTTEALLRTILADLWTALKKMQQDLLLEQQDMLTTLIVLLADEQHGEGIAIAIGDGLISINGQTTIFDQDNKPDYLGYHLHKDFSKWYASLTQKIYFNDITDITIATDGICLFQPYQRLPAETETDPVDFLVHDTTGIAAEDMLQRKLKTLEHIYGLRPADDIAIIRMIKTVA
ncbi:hypothetical protein ECE50_003060 [Chitinophaga sp. Mgbs1]|uniref:PPM-type phosphatase domain-containing protein n=1 Tax=Chitinophaga solisilvae TaxID=1233460 RepID=A0A3S1B0R4_9BACT|nr:hypothetical protein [Chitinophaga solisilvae]